MFQSTSFFHLFSSQTNSLCTLPSFSCSHLLSMSLPISCPLVYLLIFFSSLCLSFHSPYCCLPFSLSSTTCLLPSSFSDCLLPVCHFVPSPLFFSSFPFSFLPFPSFFVISLPPFPSLFLFFSSPFLLSVSL